jgi:hypothetical protein
MPPSQSSSSPSSDAGQELARRLLARETPKEAVDAGRIDAAERVCAAVSEGLTRWFGLYGGRVLVTRALARARADHRSLGVVSLASEPSPQLVGLAESARAHGVNTTIEGIEAMLAALFDLIARLIGEDLATSLLEQRSTPPATTKDAHQTVKKP